jgi:hypothetical protein
MVEQYTERWQHRFAQVMYMKQAWKEQYEEDLTVRPVAGLIKDGEKVYAYGYDAALISGLLELPLEFQIVINAKGEKTALPCFESYAEAEDFIGQQLQDIKRSWFIMTFVEPDVEKGDEDDDSIDQNLKRWG